MGRNRKGQVSAEMLILLAVVVAIVAIAATYLTSASNNAGESVTSQSGNITQRMDFASKGNNGDYCQYDSDCKSDNCDDTNTHKCES